MLRTQSSVEPQAINISILNKIATVRMAKNVEQKTREDENGGSTYYEYDEVFFKMPFRSNLQQDIDRNFDIYFGYGIQCMEQQEILKSKQNEVQRLISSLELPNELQVLMLAIVEGYEEIITISLENNLAIAEIYERLEG